ncbi:MAG TPA: hypothetical protein VJP77_09765 [Planctomycetota bacterium]|nr:hypothetical protein [Planctomycetota bacterium]
MQSDSEFEAVREYHVWGVENGRLSYCPFATFEEAEEVRLNGLPRLPCWTPKRRSRVRIAVALYRKGPQPLGRVRRPVYVATCDEIHRPCREVRRRKLTVNRRAA